MLLQILDKELTHLEKAACHLDPLVQRAEAATVKLLASALLQVRKTPRCRSCTVFSNQLERSSMSLTRACWQYHYWLLLDRMRLCSDVLGVWRLCALLLYVECSVHQGEICSLHCVAVGVCSLTVIRVSSEFLFIMWHLRSLRLLCARSLH
jgi:hypothetical protein